MSRIAINDLNPVDSYLLELTNEELVMISGEGLLGQIIGIIVVIAGAVTSNPAMVAAGTFIYETFGLED